MNFHFEKLKNAKNITVEDEYAENMSSKNVVNFVLWKPVFVGHLFFSILELMESTK